MTECAGRGRWLTAVAWLLTAATGVAGFNVDTEHMVRFRGTRGSMFGFSVAEHRDRQGNWVLVGAPKADTSQFQLGVTEGGAVFRCDVRSDGYCQPLPFDRHGNNKNSSGMDIDRKSHQWFGATVHSSGDGAIVACAPRYVFFPPTAPEPFEDPVGTCYVARDEFRRITEYAPCRTSEWGYHRQGYCQAGFSACLSKDGDRVFIGAPGSWYWQGRLYSVNAYASLKWSHTVYNFSYPPGQVYSQSLYNRPDVISTPEGPKQSDDSYLGYSVATGDFTGDGTSGAAVGMPRGNRLVGKVILYSSFLQKVGEFTGEQMGAYFGYALCVSDMDGDKTDDLVVGAPLYTHLQNNEGKYETGRIYVIYQKKGTNRFATHHWRDGVNSKSRFGLSLASVGDLNKDGYGDIAVGAPYDGLKGGGAVYIYHGSATGIMKEASQVIFGESIYSQITTFGFSLSGGIDLDGNQYPDIVVGAYDADTAIFFKSRPVILMDAEVTIGPESKLISLDEKNCTLRDGTLTTCTTVTACFEYSGIGVNPEHEFEIQLILDAKKMKSPRLFFHRNEGKHMKNFTATLNNNSKYCKSHVVYIKPGIRDKLSPLEVEVKYNTKYSKQRVQRSLTPVLDQHKPLSEHDFVSIQKNCGPDNICIPNLILDGFPTVTKYLLGSNERLELEVKILNTGEDAFEATYNLKIPPGLNYSKIERIDKNEREIPVLCSAPSLQNNYTLKCDIGNPLPSNKPLHFKVHLQPFYKEDLKSQYEFVMEVNSTNPEESSSTLDNVIRFEVPISIRTGVSIIGVSSPQELYYNTTGYNVVNVTRESEIGPQLTHTYTVINNGPADIVEADLYILWPMYTLAGDPFFYILEQPEVTGPVVCEKLEEVNSLQLKIEQKKKGIAAASHHSQYGTVEVEGSSASGKKSTEKYHKTSSTSTHYETFSNGSHQSRTQIQGSSGSLEEKHIQKAGDILEPRKSDFMGSEKHNQHTSDSKNVSTGESGAVYSKSWGGLVPHSETLQEGSAGRHESYNKTSHYGLGDKIGKHKKKIHTSHNYSVTWRENDKPVHHYKNYSFTTSDDTGSSSAQWSSDDHDDGDDTYDFSDGANNSSSTFHKFTSSSSYHSLNNGSALAGDSHIDEGAHESESGIRFIPAWQLAGGKPTPSPDNFEGTLLHGSTASDGQLRHYWVNSGSNTVLQQGKRTNLNDSSGSQHEVQGGSSYYYPSPEVRGGMTQSSIEYSATSNEDNGSGVKQYISRQWSSNHPGATIHWEEQHKSTADGEQDYDEEKAEEEEEDDEDDEDDYYDDGSEYTETYSSQKKTITAHRTPYQQDRAVPYGRHKRDLQADTDFDQLLQCNSTNCVRLKCVIKKFTKDQEVNIQIRSRAWVQTLKKVASNKRLRVSSLLAMQVTQLPYIGKPYRPIIRSEEVFTDAISTDVPTKPEIVPLWVVVLSACAGVLILLLLILLLWKCGFFKRNRPSDTPEKEPLNRNGHYSNGDEAL
ncbi:integrin alpha-PS2-like isoform X1 [Schistocerca piceifrons]|uniref:integrin alpha-PS2-like isoform X1 n=1 Tax=Schistocerca piceifrons TaxID=274613 RepID=UPI001F5F1FA9|nr:integrin alpha-PS2-like isoform X1 [Schistocerca piceifrons]